MSTIVIDKFQISPSPLSPLPSPLPLTYLDTIFVSFGPVQRVFFYQLPCTTVHFRSNHLGPLKTALSLALARFRPLAGTLNLPSNEILFKEDDSIALLLAESDDNFSDLSGPHARSCTRFHPLVPPLEPGSAPLAAQLTVFPGAGVAVGVAVSHGVADGATSARFLKTWAALSRGETGSLTSPCFDRSLVLADPKGHGPVIVRSMDRVLGSGVVSAHDGKLTALATFSFSRQQINKLREEFCTKTGLSDCSSFALVYGIMLTCLVKVKGVGDDDAAGFGFVFDGRARRMVPLPPEYFGNCLGFSVGKVNVGELTGEDGWVVAAKEARAMVNGLNCKEPEETTLEALEWMMTWTRMPAVFLSVAGSPRLGLYDVDFGWGRPRKIEVVSIESTGAVSVAEWGEDGRGLEIGVVLSEELMSIFSAHVSRIISGE